jgi:hypothetical protein
MMEDVNTFYSTLEDSGVPKHHTHSMGDTMVSLVFVPVEILSFFHHSFSMAPVSLLEIM